MSVRLPLGDAIWRFRDNDQRFDIFVNGTDTQTWTTENGSTVPSLQKFLKDVAFDITDLRDRIISYLAYSIVIESTAGTTFRYGEARTTTMNARVFSNGTEVTTEIPASRFRWRRASAVPRPYPNDDATFNTIFASGYKSITVNVDDVYARATYFCDILEE